MSIYNENPIVKSGVYHWKDIFKPRWKILDMPENSALYWKCFYTEWGAWNARETWANKKPIGRAERTAKMD